MKSRISQSWRHNISLQCGGFAGKRIHRRSLQSQPKARGSLQSNVQQRRLISTSTQLLQDVITTLSPRSSVEARIFAGHGVNSTPAPPQNQVKNADAWIALIEPLLPTNFRRSDAGFASGTPEDTESFGVLVDIIAAAMKYNIDVLASLGIDHGRWDAVQWIVKSMVDQAGSPNKSITGADVFPDIAWPTKQVDGWSVTDSLDDLTLDPFTFTLSQEHPLPTRSLDSMIDTLRSDTLDKPTSKGKLILGDIWLTLGNLILAAASKTGQGRADLMPNALRIIANLHHHGWIPERVYHYEGNSDPSALQQPPLLYDLSYTMLSSLSEAAYQGDPEARVAVQTRAATPSRLFSRTAKKLPGLGPELWMEFCLWCCVHGGWVEEGSAILHAMRKYSGSEQWSLICWRDILESPDEKWEEYAQKRLQSKPPADMSDSVPGNRRAVVERTVSTEVVVATIDGLVSSMLQSGSVVKTSTSTDLFQRIATLKSLLERQRMSLGVSSWDAVIQRIADSSAVDIEQNPRLWEQVLALTETYGREISSANAPKTTEASNPVASYVFDASAAVIGLHHRTLHAFIKGRNSAGALRVLKRLQSLTDTNKTKSMEEFFTELKATPIDIADTAEVPEGKRFNFHSVFPGVQYPGFFPNIPANILADLLDLFNESGDVDIGRWMLYSKDLDGPLIPEAMYTDQQIAPALVRFAATTSDADLLTKVTKAQSTDISGPTLIALCQSRLQKRNFTGAVEILKMIREYSMHEWTIEESASLVRSLLIEIFGSVNGDARPSESSSKTALELVQRLLRGDLGQNWGSRFSQLDTVVGVITSTNPVAAQICAGMLRTDSYYRADINTRTFNVLLDGAVRCFGTEKGQELYELWCIKSAQPRNVKLAGSTTSDQAIRISPAAKFGGAVQQVPLPGLATFEGTIVPDVDTIRMIVQQRFREQRIVRSGAADIAENARNRIAMHDASAEENEAESEAEADNIAIPEEASPVNQDHILDWAAHVLRKDFKMNEIDIDYELQGYLISYSPDVQFEESYSPSTIRLWRAFTGPHRQWTSTQEHRLRAFATNKDERQLVIEHVSTQERLFLQSLSADLGLVFESFGEEAQRDVKMSKVPKRATVPLRTVDEVSRMETGSRI